MIKRSLLILTVLLLLILSGCSLFTDVKTELVVKNHGDSQKDITLITLSQFIGARASEPVNALPTGTTLAPGEEFVFEIAPYMVMVPKQYLEVEIIYQWVDDLEYGQFNIDYTPETRVELVFQLNDTFDAITCMPGANASLSLE